MAAALLSQGVRGYFCAKKSQRAKKAFCSKAACNWNLFQHRLVMELPGQPVTLTVEQIAELNKKLGTLRHDINNNLALIMAGLEVIQYKPHLAERMMATVTEQPPKIAESLGKFSAEFEKVLGLKQ
jgi:hypothetical protein